jgi:hypothetical protein
MFGCRQFVEERRELVEPRGDWLTVWAARVSAAHSDALLVGLGFVVCRSDLKGVAVLNTAYFACVHSLRLAN